ncbi:MAG: protein kinase [Ferruginibacter sp.]
MARIFTITEGVENMGALKTGGQGSVYKGKRIGEIITAIKILPTPIYSESGDDKNFTSFQNEVQKLKKVNEDANVNVVTIINSGITESGNFPFIEMEYIEGPDLEELLKPPHDKVFTIKEALKVAEQLSNALAHCHRVDVKHGDIKSNNVKFNVQTGNYILLDFGLSVMSDEQRRTSLRQAGAIEFMAPEQHEGELLFQTEIYSFGVIMFELLSGSVPFPLKDNTESSRNTTMVAQMENEPPNLLSLRQQNLPVYWSEEKKTHEMQVPEWLISMIYKCLEKKPADRFANGMELNEYIVRNSILAAGKLEWGADRIARLEQENERLKKEKNELQEKVASYENIYPVLADQLRSSLNKAPGAAGNKRLRNIWFGLVALALIASAAYFFISRQQTKTGTEKEKTLAKSNSDSLPETEEQRFQLRKAKGLLTDGRIEEARSVYRSLALQEIPEAMYEYGNLTLLNNSDKDDCAEAMSYLKKASSRGHLAAKRTVGLLYSFAADTTSLQQKGYQRCRFNFDIRRGSKLLMEAALAGDSASGVLLDELNVKYGR